MSDYFGRNKVKTAEQGSVQKSIAEADRRRYKCECDSSNDKCSIQNVYGNHGVPLQSAGDLVSFIKASTEQAVYNASLCKGEKPQTCINMCTVIKLQ